MAGRKKKTKGCEKKKKEERKRKGENTFVRHSFSTDHPHFPWLDGAVGVQLECDDSPIQMHDGEVILHQRHRLNEADVCGVK